VSPLLAIPIVLPLFGAGISLGVGRSRAAQRLVGLVTLVIVAVDVGILVGRVDDRGVLVSHAGGWRAPVGITFVADRLAAIVLLTSVLTLLAVLVFAIGQPGTEDRHVGFHPTYLILTAGVSFALLTGDLFNLFVAFEVMLMASYVLLTMGGRADQVRSGMTYVVISLVASALFLFSLALVYAATGTVNLADLGPKVAALPDGVRSGLAVLLIVVFGIKAAIFPLFFWLPDSYPTAAAPVTAVFAGLLTKIGVYAIIRTQTSLFPPETRPGTLLLVVAGLTMVVGVLGAVTQTDMKRLLSFHIVSQIGYMIMGIGLFTVAGLAGAIVFIVHQIVVKASLFLVAGLVEERAGTDSLGRLGGLARSEPVVAGLFLVAALSLAGIPPFSGFVGKLALIEAGVASRSWVIVAVSLAVSLLTLYSMTKIWSYAFWGTPPDDGADEGDGAVAADDEPPAGRGRWALMTGATVGLVAVSLVIAVAAGPLYDYAERAAEDLLDRSAYAEAVLEP
jgi:multicomponent Na+:H+ antiporter subunit D